MSKRLRVKQIRSTIGRLKNHKLTVKALGLKKMGSIVEHEDTPSIRGMINTVNYLLHVEEITGE